MPVLRAADLQSYANALLRAGGATPEEADVVARSLVDANAPKVTTEEGDEKIVTIYRGAERDTYNCQADCRRRSAGGG